MDKILNKIVGSETAGWLLFIIDSCVVLTSFSFVHFLHFGLVKSLDDLFIKLPIVLVLALLSFGWIVNYKKSEPYFTYSLFFKIQIASIVQAILIYGLSLVDKELAFFSFDISLGFSVFYLVFNSSLLILVRMLLEKLRIENFNGVDGKQNVLIFDDPSRGALIAKGMDEILIQPFQLIGIVSDEIGSDEKMGVPVFNLEDVTEEFLRHHRVSFLLFSKEDIASHRLFPVFTFLSGIANQVKIKIYKSYPKGQKINIQQFETLKLNDLIERVTMDSDEPLLKNEYEEKVVMITGAAGSIGSEIAKQVGNFKCKKLILIDQAESDLYELQNYFYFKKNADVTAVVGDVSNYKRMQQLFEHHQPQIVFHAAAYKHVPFMEVSPFDAIEVNILGTKNLADLSIIYKVDKFIFVSTDKAVNPKSVMGASKRIAELYLKGIEKGSTKFVTTRFGNVIGSKGSVIPLFQSQIDKGGPISLTDKEISRFFMTIPQASQLLIEAGAKGQGDETYIFEMGPPIKIMEIAIYMIRIAGLKYPDDIAIEITGLRPGEKMDEELLTADEQAVPLENEKMMLVTSSKQVKPEFVNDTNELCVAFSGYSEKVLLEKLEQLLPGFNKIST